MTINLANNNPRISYSVAQGATQQTFAVPFEFFNDSDITVYVDGILKTEGSDYTLTGGDGSTGNVVFVTATPPAVQQVLGATGGSTVVIFRTTDIERTSDFSAGSDINRAALNEQLDILTAMIADQNDKTDRTIRLNDYETAPSLILPSIANRKGKVLAFNATTGAVEEGPTSANILNVESFVATATAAATSATASAASAAASFDSFDDRYLGSKTSNPTLDNDGNSLLTGALYYDSVNLLMKVYTGSAWSSLLTSGSSITANSSTPALTINQIGSGAALLVEDDTSPDSSPFIVDASGRVGIGSTTPTSLLYMYSATTNNLSVVGDSTTAVVLTRSSTDGNAPALNFRKNRGSTAVPLAVANGDTVGLSNYTAYDGASNLVLSQIIGAVEKFTGVNDVSGSLIFNTRQTGTGSTATERFRIASAGQLGIGGENYGTSGQAMISGGSAAAPAWGVLPVSGGGTGVTASTGTGSVALSASPELTGTPTAPTATVGTNTTQVATTAFVLANTVDASLVNLGDIITTSGTSQTLSGLNLTPYQFIHLVFRDISHNSGTTGRNIRIGPNLSIIGQSGSASRIFVGIAKVYLGAGTYTSVGGEDTTTSVNAGTVAVGYAGRCGITNASTSITVSLSADSFDAGRVTIYGEP